jgi:phospholipid/cholesterol/gamma-HCH transport system permease protein
MSLLAPPKITFNPTEKIWVLSGNWTIHTITQIAWPELGSLSNIAILNCQKIQRMDSAGAYAIIEWQQTLKKNNIQIKLEAFSKEKAAFFDLVNKKIPEEDVSTSTEQTKDHTSLWNLGYEAYLKYLQFIGLLTLIGDLLLTIYRNFGQKKRFHIEYIISNIAQTGIYALPILGLLSFLIGIVLAYQMGLQLETYGANIFIAFLSGMAIFREFGPLITAIIVAGRTSSAFTAQIGSMKLNEEIDALETMGLSPTEFLVAPKVIALILVFPLLIFWSNLFGILGAMFMSKTMLHIGYHDFLVRLKESVGLKQMMLGIYKAPAFSIIISLVGCFQGFRVGNSADSVGHQTTKSVVQSLFLIIIADAIYSIIYSALDL